jgi:hypothetical protein
VVAAVAATAAGAGAVAAARFIQGKKTVLFATVCTPKMIICQDRLGTNIGKALQKEYRFLAQRFFGE